MTYRGGHPWEVCRGGNSTHISLYVWDTKDGYYLTIAGSAVNRTIEAVKFYLALRDPNLPVRIRQCDILVNRLLEHEKIGIVPESVTPLYCESYFPDEDIICFMNLPEEKRELLLPYCIWQPIAEVRLKTI